MVFFGVYVTVMLKVLALRPLPFVVSFTAYFIALHVIEALCLRRLFASRCRAAVTLRRIEGLAPSDLQQMAHDQVQEHAAEAAAEGFNAGEVIIEHVANSALDHPLIHLPTIAGIDFSVTKHVFMLWLVAAIVFVVVTAGRPALSSGRTGSCRPAS